MKSLSLLITLTLGISTAHAATETEAFFQEIGVPSDALNDNGLQVIEQDIAQSPESVDVLPTPTPNPADEIPEGELKILGKGFYDRKTGDSIALAYYTGPSIDYKGMENCTRLRHVFVDGATRKARYIGNDYILSCDQTSDPKEIKRRLKDLNKGFKQYRREANHNRNFWIFTAGGVAMAPIVWFASPASWMVAAAGGLPAAVGVYAGAVVVWAIVGSIYNNHGTLFARNAGGSSTILIDRNGWNWSSNPKKITHRTFNLYLKFIQRGQRY